MSEKGQKMFWLDQKKIWKKVSKVRKNNFFDKSEKIRNPVWQLCICSELIPNSGPKATIKVDPASAFRNLLNDKELEKCGILLELGHPKYRNKIPVCDRGIRELHSEMNRIHSESPSITEKTIRCCFES